jgi:hypothetical protein
MYARLGASLWAGPQGVTPARHHGGYAASPLVCLPAHNSLGQLHQSVLKAQQ